MPTLLLSTAEWKLIYKVLYRNVGGTATHIEAIDQRQVSTGPAGTAVPASHTALIDRDAANSHPVEAITDAARLDKSNSLNITTINRTAGVITSIVLSDGRTLTYTRDGDDYIESFTDGTNTWTVTRDGDGYIATLVRTP